MKLGVPTVEIRETPVRFIGTCCNNRHVGSGEVIPTETWEVAITEDSRFLFNGVEVEGEKLLSVLETARRLAPELQIVVLRADRAATVGEFVTVMDTIRQTGFYNLVIATDQKPDTHEQRTH